MVENARYTLKMKENKRKWLKKARMGKTGRNWIKRRGRGLGNARRGPGTHTRIRKRVNAVENT